MIPSLNLKPSLPIKIGVGTYAIKACRKFLRLLVCKKIKIKPGKGE